MYDFLSNFFFCPSPSSSKNLWFYQVFKKQSFLNRAHLFKKLWFSQKSLIFEEAPYLQKKRSFF